ncbi:helicase-related protein [Gottfriedia sp. NPDC057991]|uniref:helicase-related protein n=1 Tax=Gottfriedia sp. NPDC057991 TaxID=3346298 RepID=UPI0036DEA00C
MRNSTIFMSFRNDYGLIYEFGYNIGLYFALCNHPEVRINEGVKKVYDSLLMDPKRNLANLVIQFRKKHQITDEGIAEDIRRNIENIFFFGYLSGDFTIRNYLKSIERHQGIKIHVTYFQANFFDPIGLFDFEESNMLWHSLVKESFKLDLTPEEMDQYGRKGRFLRADSIVLFKQGKKQYGFVTDNGMHLHHLVGIDGVDEFQKSLKRIRSELGKKTKFANLSIDTRGFEGFHLHQTVLKYASLVRDKTLVKSVQSGSYAYSFIQFLLENDLLQSKTIELSLMAQNDYDYSIINLTLPCESIQQTEQWLLLKECYQQYTNGSTTNFDEEEEFVSSEALTILFENLIRNSNLNKDELKTFLVKGIGEFQLTDYMTGFQNTASKYGEGKTLRDDHAEETKKLLKDPKRNLLFLTGNPGIGKTTSIANELKKQPAFLLLYTSCRRTVNDDILSKFKENELLFSNKAIALSTTSNDEDLLSGKPVKVVNYVVNQKERIERQKSSSITYLEKEREINYEKGSHHFKEIGDDEFVEVEKRKTSGVLSRLCEGIREQIEHEEFNQIIGTFSIQALKKTKGKETTDHLKKIFPFLRYSEERDRYIVEPRLFDQFVEKVPVCWVMIDEITGAEEGVKLYQNMKKLLFEQIYLQLTEEQQKKWNVKLIVADASITNEKIINQFLEKKTRYDYPKIYISQGEQESEALELKEFNIPIKDEKFTGVMLNTNSYPARKLIINYYLNVIGIPKDEYDATKQAGKERVDRERKVSEIEDQKIIHRVMEHLLKRQGEQVIVYVQNIKRIHTMVELFRYEYEREFAKTPEIYQDYLAISSQLTTKERKKALEAIENDGVPIVFMTSSASRGISFPKTTKIMAVLQTFQVEKELMEQIQLHYRMRGNTEWDQSKEKTIDFYLVDSFIYGQNDFEWNKRKMQVHLLSFLTLVRTCLMSRMYGEAKVGAQRLSVVPLGGQGVSPVKHSLVQNVADSLKLIKKELTMKKKFKLLEDLKEELIKTFGQLEMFTNDQVFKMKKREEIFREFNIRAKTNLYQLQSYQPFHEFMFLHGMLVFRIPDRVSDHVKFLIHNRERSEQLIQKIIEVKQKDLTNDLKKKLSHIQEMLEFEQKQQGRMPNKYVEESKDEKRYIVFPLLSFTIFQELKDHKQSPDEESFLELLSLFVRGFADISSVTPIVGEYQDLPYISFKSDALEEVVDSRFKQNHLLVSTETNVLNLLLLEH